MRLQGLSESTLVKMPHCWKSCVAAHLYKSSTKCSENGEGLFVATHFQYSLFSKQHQLLINDEPFPIPIPNLEWHGSKDKYSQIFSDLSSI